VYLVVGVGSLFNVEGGFMPKVFKKGIRNKNIRARTVKAARGNMISVGGFLTAAIMLIIGFAAFNAGFTNVGPIFLLLGGFVLLLSLLPVIGLPGWVVAVIAVGGLAVVVVGSMPFVDTMLVELDVFLDDLPTFILEWIFSGV